MPQLVPYVIGFQPKRCADRPEGEKPLRVIAEKPILCFPRLLNEPALLFKPFLKAEKSIFEHSVHQRGLRAHGSETDPGVEKPIKKHAVAGRPLIRGGSPGGDPPGRLFSIGDDLFVVHDLASSRNPPRATQIFTRAGAFPV